MVCFHISDDKQVYTRKLLVMSDYSLSSTISNYLTTDNLLIHSLNIHRYFLMNEQKCMKSSKMHYKNLPSILCF